MRRSLWWVLAACVGCFGGSDGGNGSADGGAAGGGGSSVATAPDGGVVTDPSQLYPDDVGDVPDDPGPRCLFSAVSAEVSSRTIDKVDLLFVVDNSGSMREEQEALRREFPRLLTTLTTGERTGNDPRTGMPYAPFPRAADLHLGVVSTDMGLVGIPGIPGCDGLGDDGIMNNIPDAELGGCQASYPRFLSYLAGVNDTASTANDFGCIASLGTEGCGFEQPLEAALKALWPSVDVDPETGAVYEPNRVLFLGDSMGFGQLGHGDIENTGFLRNDPQMGISLIAITVVTDEADCSSADTSHFLPDVYLDPNDPAQAELSMQDLNLRCFYNKQNLYDLRRYAPTMAGEPGHPSPGALRALRPGNEQLVLFNAIVGVPPDAVDASVDFDDDDARDSYYANILAHPAMQEVPDTSLPPGEGNLIPSCLSDTDGDGTAESRAYPPRRIVEVAQRFGPQGTVQSICMGTFAPAMNAIIDNIAKQLGGLCLPRPLVRDADGSVGCELTWELPPPGAAPSETPTDCSLPFLSEPGVDQSHLTARGGQVCVVEQLAVSSGQEPSGQGWYYDDFSEQVLRGCQDAPHRISFTPSASPPTGVTVKLTCASTTSTAVTDCDEAFALSTSVGNQCAPDTVPEGGFDDREAYVESSSEECGVGPCLVFRLQGDPREGCRPQAADCEGTDPSCGGVVCPSQADIDERVYCSCRCDGPEGSGPMCECPDGFSCVPVLEQGPDAIRGSYCVRNGTFVSGNR